MTDTSPNLALPYLQAAQAQKHVTLNEALRQLDGLVNIMVRSRSLTDQPLAPLEGDRYILPGSATGPAWGAQPAGTLMCHMDGGWHAFSPRTGWPAYVEDEQAQLVFSGTAWRNVSELIRSLEFIEAIGLGTESSGATPFIAKLNAALWTARSPVEDGSGDMRMTFNKSATANVLSLLLQSDYAACAEIGLVGSDDVSVRVSPDGNNFLTALTVRRSDGQVSFPQGVAGLRERLTAPRTYHVDPSSGSDEADGRTSSSALATISKAIERALALDLGPHDVTIQCAPGTYAESLVLPCPFLGSGRVRLVGNVSSPAACIIASSSNCLRVESGALIDVEGFFFDNTGGNCGIFCLNGGAVNLTGSVAFGTSGRAHIRVEGPASICRVLSGYEISGDAPRHLEVIRIGRFTCHEQTITLAGTRTFATGFAICNEQASLQLTSVIFSGTAAGRRYRVSSLGLINAGGSASSFPGDIAGIAETQGLAI